MTVFIKAKRLKVGMYLVERTHFVDVQENRHFDDCVYTPVVRKWRRPSAYLPLREVCVQDRSKSMATYTWTFDPDQDVEILTDQERIDLELPAVKRWWHV